MSHQLVGEPPGASLYLEGGISMFQHGMVSVLNDHPDELFMAILGDFVEGKITSPPRLFYEFFRGGSDRKERDFHLIFSLR